MVQSARKSTHSKIERKRIGMRGRAPIVKPHVLNSDDFKLMCRLENRFMKDFRSMKHNDRSEMFYSCCSTYLTLTLIGSYYTFNNT